MAFLIKGVFNLIGTTIKYTLVAGTFTAITAVATKPQLETFDTYFKNFISNNLQDNKEINKFGVFSSFIKDGLSWGASQAASRQVMDYVFFKSVKISYGIDNKQTENMHFIGAFNGWYRINN